MQCYELNPSKYGRTALGHYPVMGIVKNPTVTTGTTGETITLKGFNLDSSNGGTLKKVSVGSKDTGLQSGDYEYTFGGVKTLNNLNDDSIEYNKQPNGDNNLRLTDNVVFDVWELNEKAVIGKGGSISAPSMKINPNNKQVGFAFTSGTHFMMPSSTNSYNY